MGDVMNNGVMQAIEMLRSVTWFSECGKPLVIDAEVVGKVEREPSFESALQSIQSLEWGNFRLEVGNVLTVHLSQYDKERFSKWNSIVREHKPTIISLVDSKCQETTLGKELPKKVIDAIKWDLLNMCMEGEYSDIANPNFYVPLTYWYAAGRLPCGWVGDWPHGKFLVY